MSGRVPLLAMGFLVGVVAVVPVGAQESPNFRIERITVASGTATVTSANFDNSIVIAPAGPSGAGSRCNVGSQNSLGFWSILGDVPVPIRLELRPGATVPEDVTLSWTGAAGEFQVFRAFAPDDVTNLNNLLAETPQCAAQDTTATAASIVYYQVIPTP